MSIGSFADAVAAVGPSVVGILVHREPVTGVVWDARTIVTVSHALRHDSVEVVRPDGSTIRARKVGRDRGTDIGLLSVDVDLVPAPWAQDSSALRVGDLVVAIGRPGRALRATLGLVSGLGGAWQTHHGVPIDRYIDVDGSLPVGFGGGPLVGYDGTIVGINTPGLVQGGTTVPIETVRRAIESARRGGGGDRAYLGLGLQPAGLGDAQRAAAGTDGALLVVSVDPGGPGEKGGIAVGDLVLSLGGQPVRDLRELLRILLSRRGGETIGLEVLRGNEKRTTSVTLGTKPHRC
jgi:S1-C subfamily serine protease